MQIARWVGWVLAVTIVIPGVVAAQSGNEVQRSFLWKQCDEDAIFFYVDPEPLTRVVPTSHSLALVDGKARVLIAAQNCPAYWIDGEDIGATLEVHHWVAVQGNADIREIAGAESTLPTMTWFALFTGSSNPLSRQRWTSSGTTSHEIEALSLVVPQPTGGGRVSITEDLEYSWQMKRGEPIVKSVGVNHDVYSTNANGSLVYHRIQCLGSVFAWASEGSLTVTGGTEPSKLISTGTYPATVYSFLPIWCRASLADSPPE
jgi:hypothetical protein